VHSERSQGVRVSVRERSSALPTAATKESYYRKETYVRKETYYRGKRDLLYIHVRERSAVLATTATGPVRCAPTYTYTRLRVYICVSLDVSGPAPLSFSWSPSPNVYIVGLFCLYSRSLFLCRSLFYSLFSIGSPSPPPSLSRSLLPSLSLLSASTFLSSVVDTGLVFIYIYIISIWFLAPS
jgi:hypothetical protein